MLISSRSEFMAGLHRGLNQASPDEREEAVLCLKRWTEVPGDTPAEMVDNLRLREQEKAARIRRFHQTGSLLRIGGFLGLAATTLSPAIPLGPGLAIAGTAWLLGRGLESYARRHEDPWHYAYSPPSSQLAHWVDRVEALPEPVPAALPAKTPDSIRLAVERAAAFWLDPSGTPREELVARAESLSEEDYRKVYGYHDRDYHHEFVSWLREQHESTLAELEKAAENRAERLGLLRHEGLGALDGIGEAAFWIGIFSNRVGWLTGVGVKAGIWALTSVTGLERRVNANLELSQRRVRQLDDWRRHLMLEDYRERQAAVAGQVEAWKEIGKLAEPERPQSIGEKGESLLVGGVVVPKRKPVT